MVYVDGGCFFWLYLRFSYSNMANFIKQSVINKAMKVAQGSDVLRAKVGAVLFTNNGNIITQACNSSFYGLDKKKIFTIHAERYLLAKAFRLKALHRFQKLNILVVRYKKSIKGFCNAKPCVECAFYLKEAGLPVYYTDDDGNIQKLK